MQKNSISVERQVNIHDLLVASSSSQKSSKLYNFEYEMLKFNIFCIVILFLVTWHQTKLSEHISLTWMKFQMKDKRIKEVCGLQIKSETFIFNI